MTGYRRSKDYQSQTGAWKAWVLSAIVLFVIPGLIMVFNR